MKKAVVLILMFLLVLSSFSTVYADSNVIQVGGSYNTDYIDIYRISVSLNITGNTALCSGSAKSMISTDTIKMTMYLQKQTSTGWSNVASWYKQDIRLVSLNKSKSGLSSGTYRVFLYVEVFDSNGNYIESANAFSKLKIVS